MAYYKVNGNKKLNGLISISGAKNAAVAIIPATILCGGKCTLKNVPDIEDVRILIKLLKAINAKVNFDKTTNIMEVDATHIAPENYRLMDDSMRDLRASYYFLGALLGRLGRAHIKLPGGCDIGSRPMDLHIKGLSKLDVELSLEEKSNTIYAVANNKNGMLFCADGRIDFPQKSVGATINVMLAASKITTGELVITNAAKEPHVVDVANFLNAMGADIKGAGTDNIKIRPSKTGWHGCTYEVIPDQIETGTFMIAAAAAGGHVELKNVIPKHMESLTKELIKCGVKITDKYDGERDYLIVDSEGATGLKSTHIKTMPYPGFPTDLQQPMAALLCCIPGASSVEETIFESRFAYTEQLKRMGADIEVENKRIAYIKGKPTLTGADVVITDLRAGAALVVAALMAHGESTVREIHYLDRGYERFEEKLRELGASIERVEE